MALNHQRNPAPNCRDGMCRLRDPKTRDYLHFSGWPVKLVSGTAYAWSGSRKQAETLRARAETRGEAFPFEIVSMEGM